VTKAGTRVVSPRFVRLARAAGLPVQVWVVDEVADVRRLLTWGVTGFISDRPDVVKATLAAAGG
jgi:glycerophosphoryl diester phosphodiesterase